eukprot:scaffold4850_cov213-Pinguiococcus_pyrenoidosus.AAC.7
MEDSRRDELRLGISPFNFVAHVVALAAARLRHHRDVDRAAIHSLVDGTVLRRPVDPKHAVEQAGHELLEEGVSRRAGQRQRLAQKAAQTTPRRRGGAPAAGPEETAQDPRASDVLLVLSQQLPMVAHEEPGYWHHLEGRRRGWCVSRAEKNGVRHENVIASPARRGARRPELCKILQIAPLGHLAQCSRCKRRQLRRE